MTRYTIPPSISFCLIDTRPVFLDIAKDRYFRLADSTERLFARWLAGEPTDGAELDPLVQAGILLADSGSTRPRAKAVVNAERSALEIENLKIRLQARMLPDVLACLWLTQRQLKTLGLQATIERAFRSSPNGSVIDTSCDALRVIEFAHAFLAVRRLIPLDNHCLLDSIAMAHFLRKRRLLPDLVIGVTSDPFSAHCWVQTGDMVLNDTVGNVRIYTPIKVA